MNIVTPTPEQLFIAGCAGALASTLVITGKDTIQLKYANSKDLPSVIIFIILGGYVPTFVLEVSEIHMAFALGSIFEIALSIVPQIFKRRLTQQILSYIIGGLINATNKSNNDP